MWAYPLVGQEEDGAMWKTLVEGFNAMHPDVKITVELQPWDRRVEKLGTAMAAGIGPDVWYINIEDIPNHAKNGRLVALDDALTAEDKADFLPASLEAMSWDGTLWASPILVAIYSSFHNTEVFAAAGVSEFPATWDAMLEAAPVFKDAGYYLTEFETGDAQAYFYPLIWQAGGEPFTDGKPTFNSPEGVAALEFVLELFKGEYAPQSVAAAEGIPIGETPIGLGEIAMALPAYGSGEIQQLADIWGEGALEISAPPKNVEQVNTGGVAGYAVSSASKNQEAAKAWVQYITNPDSTTLINQTSGYLPPRVSVGDIHAGDPVLSALGATLPYMRAFPSIIGGRQILTDALAPELESAILGDKSAQQALDDAAARAEEIIAEQSA
jgi:multiple sugar transport system substrate-binding protein